MQISLSLRACIWTSTGATAENRCTTAMSSDAELSLAGARLSQSKLERFWGAHARTFAAWFMALPLAGQTMVLRNCSPDMPPTAPAEGEACGATAVILPELNVESLVASGGRGLVALFEARSAMGAGGADAADCCMLMKLHARGRMPCFSQNAFEGLALAWVDPADPEENVRGLAVGCADEHLAGKQRDILSGTLVEAEVWTTKRMRQAALLAFLLAVAAVFEREFFTAKKPPGKGQAPALRATMGCRVCGVTKAKEGSGALLMCPCGAAGYCCKDCQKKDWKAHKTDCKRIMAAKKLSENCEKMGSKYKA